MKKPINHMFTLSVIFALVILLSTGCYTNTNEAVRPDYKSYEEYEIANESKEITNTKKVTAPPLHHIDHHIYQRLWEYARLSLTSDAALQKFITFTDPSELTLQLSQGFILYNNPNPNTRIFLVSRYDTGLFFTYVVATYENGIISSRRGFWYPIFGRVHWIGTRNEAALDIPIAAIETSDGSIVILAENNNVARIAVSTRPGATDMLNFSYLFETPCEKVAAVFTVVPILEKRQDRMLSYSDATIHYFVDTVCTEVLSFSDGTIQLRIKNNAQHSFQVPPSGQRSFRLDHWGVLGIDYFDGHCWIETTPYYHIDLFDFERYLDFEYVYLTPGEYAIVEYCLAVHQIPETDLGLYRIRLQMQFNNHGARPYLPRGWNRHTLVAEFQC